MLEELVSGNNSVLEIYEHKYLDTMYEMKYGYDLILDSVSAKYERKRRQDTENYNKKKEQEMLMSV
jgi:hypothetical protein